MRDDAKPQTIKTSAGTVEYLDHGTGAPVLWVHGSPGGSDQGALMTEFLVDAGFRVIAPSRPGYLGTPLTADNATPDAQATLHLALLDALGLDRVALACWSGGGPSSYRVAARAPERVSLLVAIAAVSQAYTFAGGVEARMMEGRFAKWLFHELERHAPKSLITSTLKEEGHLTRTETKDLVHEVWDDPTKRDFVLRLSETIADRRTGLDNDHAQFPKIDDLGLGQVQVPTLLVHGTVDTDVPPEHTEHAAAQLPHATVHHIEHGTHIAVWTDPTSETVQQRVVDHLR